MITLAALASVSPCALQHGFCSPFFGMALATLPAELLAQVEGAMKHCNPDVIWERRSYSGLAALT